MSIVDTMAVAAAERLERTAGPGPALAAYRALAMRVAAVEPRTRALAGALRCAARASTPEDVAALAAWWSKAGAGDHLDDVIEACKAMVSRERADVAVKLAGAEVDRQRSPRALYLLARSLEAAGDGAAADAFALATKSAERDGVADVAVAARARLTELVAPTMLRSPSPYERATALAALETRAKTGDKASMLRAAYHADDRAGLLTAIEAERIGATLRYWPDAASRESALTRLRALAASSRTPERSEGSGGPGSPHADDAEAALVRACESAKETYGLAVRARAVLGGGGAGSYANLDAGPESTEHALARLGLDVVVALRRGRDGDAAAALMEARSRAPRAEAIAAPAWTGALLALSAPSESVRAEAGALAAALLDVARPPPPRGFLPLAAALERADRRDVAIRALRAAVMEGEPTAREALARALVARGWSLASVDRRSALEALREARALTRT